MPARSSESGLSYRDAGVDIDAGDAVVAGIRNITDSSTDPRVIRDLGHFGGFFRIGATRPGATLVASIDGVGTKLLVASLAGQHEWIGEDIVHHCVNDLLACGAEPLFFLDYFGTGKLDPDAALTVIGGITRACQRLGIALLGGETAEMPGLYSGHDYDLVGAIVGIVSDDEIVDGTNIRPGDVILGLKSDGFHTNGYSLVRAALGLNDSNESRRLLEAAAPFDTSRTLGEILLQPHRSYRDVVARALASGAVRGMAHITGGGIAGNVARIIPAGSTAEISVDSWDVPAIFEYVAQAGKVPREECFQAFNMGIGFVLVCRSEDLDALVTAVPEATVIGHVVQAADDQRVRMIQRGV